MASSKANVPRTEFGIDASLQGVSQMSFQAKRSEVEAATQPRMLSRRGQDFQSRENTLGFATGCLDLGRHEKRKPKIRSAKHDNLFLGVLLDVH